VAATAREALLGLGAAHFRCSPTELSIDGGEGIRVGGEKVSLAALIGDKSFSLKVNPNGVRLRAVPFTAARVRAALAKA
jgi:hypothetical protein